MSGIVQHLLATPMWLTLAVVFALPALESSAFLGFVFPGETALLLGGVSACQGHVPVVAVALAGVAGAVVWGGLMVAIGYFAGNSWHAVAHLVTGVGGAVTIAVVAALVGVRLVRRLAHRAARRRVQGGHERPHRSDRGGVAADRRAGRVAAGLLRE
ncbi:hypothetical protein JCM18899A_15890 [Nocardioides sp. AN3]